MKCFLAYPLLSLKCFYLSLMASVDLWIFYFGNKKKSHNSKWRNTTVAKELWENWMTVVVKWHPLITMPSRTREIFISWDFFRHCGKTNNCPWCTNSIFIVRLWWKHSWIWILFPICSFSLFYVMFHFSTFGLVIVCLKIIHHVKIVVNLLMLSMRSEHTHTRSSIIFYQFLMFETPWVDFLCLSVESFWNVFKKSFKT